MEQMMQDLCSVLAKGSEHQRALFRILSRSPSAPWRLDLGEGRMGEGRHGDQSGDSWAKVVAVDLCEAEEAPVFLSASCSPVPGLPLGTAVFPLSNHGIMLTLSV